MIKGTATREPMAPRAAVPISRRLRREIASMQSRIRQFRRHPRNRLPRGRGAKISTRVSADLIQKRAFNSITVLAIPIIAIGSNVRPTEKISPCRKSGGPTRGVSSRHARCMTASVMNPSE